MTSFFKQIKPLHFLAYTIGCAFYAFALIYVNIPNKLAEGGVTGITLIFRALFSIDPAITNIIFNIPILILGYLKLGKRQILTTFYCILILSFWLWFFQQVPLTINLSHDKLISALLAGLSIGLGLGLVFRFGSTTGGSDIIARIIEQKFGIAMGKSLFAIDAIVLAMSLVYLDFAEMMYTLIMSFVSSNVINFIQDGGYSAREFMIFSKFPTQIAEKIMKDIERGSTYIDIEGGYERKPGRAVYVVVDPSEVRQVREIINEIDPKAFVSIRVVSEQLGEGFTYLRKKRSIFGR
ncbi:YitT family protein [Oenococcus sicerae]|uniref:YitT family protein n=1 Tax=Oenococcus sicerae TaxID=2203724 RepID=A0ABX5QN15_9LACO|nr:YitT family protein [Oenococcus sicerae]QAS70178.1 YitT family protein [Oenococcus sicerae]